VSARATRAALARARGPTRRGGAAAGGARTRVGYHRMDSAPCMPAQEDQLMLRRGMQ
jgi:hypothetical protein